VKLGEKHGAIGEANSCDSFSLAPTTSAIEFSQSTNLTNGRADGKGLNMSDLTKNCKVHSRIVTKPRELVKRVRWLPQPN